MKLEEQVKNEYQNGKIGIKIGNRLVYDDNVEVFKNWKNNIDPYNFGNRSEFLANTKLYNDEFNVNDIDLEFDTKFGVINEDCILVAKDLVIKNYNPVILNLASNIRACGGYEKGMSAQEESLCRSSNLSQSLYQFQNPISRGRELKRIKDADVKYRGYGYPMDLNFGAIYTSNVTFFRDSSKSYFKELDKPFKCGVISVAALSFKGANFTANDEICYMNENGGFTSKGEEIQLNKIRTILRVALKNGHDSLVLGAFGCGVYKLPVNEVSMQFKKVFEEKEFKNKFKLVVFAIMQSKKDPDKSKDFYDLFGEYNMNN